jgi:hypothetical protein
MSAKCPTNVESHNTVKPVYSGHLREIDKMTTIYRWPLYEGFDYSMKYSTLIVNKRL